MTLSLTRIQRSFNHLPFKQAEKTFSVVTVTHALHWKTNVFHLFRRVFSFHSYPFTVLTTWANTCTDTEVLFYFNPFLVRNFLLSFTISHILVRYIDFLFRLISYISIHLVVGSFSTRFRRHLLFLPLSSSFSSSASFSSCFLSCSFFVCSICILSLACSF